MSGIGMVLNTAKGAIAAQQYGINVTGHNIANVNTNNYSRQTIPHDARRPAQYAGFLFGTGVEAENVRRSANQLLEDRLIEERSVLAAYGEDESYMGVIENLFAASSETDISKLLPEFWNSWHDLSDNPTGPAERVIVQENGELLVSRFNTLSNGLFDLEIDLAFEIQSSIPKVNSLSEQIADINHDIVGLEVNNKVANDLRDRRNALVNELSQYLNIRTFEQDRGDITVIIGTGHVLVNNVDSYTLRYTQGEVQYETPTGGFIDVSDKITSGKIGGWLDMREEIIDQHEAELNAFAKEFIWEVNYLHSQGVGLEYLSSPIKGEYATDSSGLLDTLTFGDRIDYTEDFKMWVKDSSASSSVYSSVEVDMGISGAAASGWAGVGAPVGPVVGPFKYEFTVTEGGEIGQQINMIEMDGNDLGTVQVGADITTALNSAIAAQTITVTDGSGLTHTVSVQDIGGDAERSASSVVSALNQLTGVTAYASDNSATLDITSLLGSVDANPNDIVSFTLASGSDTATVSFRIGANNTETLANFHDAINSGVASINGSGHDLSETFNGNTAVITSVSGENIGVENFDVEDNATMTIGTFVEDTGGPANATFDLAGVTITFLLDNTGGPTGVAQNLMAGLDASNAALTTAGVSYELDAAGTGVIITRTGENSLDIANVDSSGGNNDGGFSVTGTAETLVGGIAGATNALAENAVAGTTVSPVTAELDTMDFDGSGIIESGGVGNFGAVKTATATVFLEPGYNIQSTEDGTIATGTGGLFNELADTNTTLGGSIITFGGDGGFSGFDVGDTVSFDIDAVPGPGTNINFVVATGTTDADLATDLYTALNGVLGADYDVIRTGNSVSILKTNYTAPDTPDIRITNFTDAGGGEALSVRTGSGVGTSYPDTVTLNAANTSTTSQLFGSEGVISWEKFDSTGLTTGVTGSIDVEDIGPYLVDGTLEFNLSAGSLVSGNTFTLNTDTTGVADSIDFTATGRANSVQDTYTFKVITGGEIGSDQIVMEWSNTVTTGTITLEAPGAPVLPEENDGVIDGMTLQFNSGTLFADDEFTITSDRSGTPTVNLPSDWHWTLDSFANQFNRQSPGVSATVNLDNTLTFEANTNGRTLQNFNFVNSQYPAFSDPGFNNENTTISIDNYQAITILGNQMRLERSGGDWIVPASSNPGYTVSFSALDDNNLDNGFHVLLDGTRAFTVTFDTPISNDGYIEFDITPTTGNYTFAFSDDETGDSGLAAALGLNTFFTGEDALSIDINSLITDNRYIAAAKIDADSGEFGVGDNRNSLDLANLQFALQDISQWNHERGQDSVSTSVNSTLEGYYQTLIGNMGVEAQSFTNAKLFSEGMVNELTAQRDAVSAVSLDEEMINLIKYQQAFSAAAKLLTVADEMLSTLISVR